MAGYTRVDTINNIADGNVINAADLDGEFDGIQAAFNSSTGHNHDGTAGEGAPILALGPAQDVTISASVLGVKTTNTVDLGTSSLKFKDFYLAGAASVGGTLGVTGVATLTAQPVLSSLTASQAVFTDASKGLVSNAITGTGNVVMSASPTLTGTLGAAAATFSGAVALNGNTTIGDADTDTITQAASYVTGTQLKSAKTATNTLSLAAYDVDGTAYTNLITLTASNTPTLALTSTGVGTINNMSIGATTASTGAFTTLSSTGNTTLGDASADAITVNGTVTSNLIFTDNTYDIGASGATRPRTGYFGTSVISPLVDATNLEVTNLKALDGTAAGSIANSTGVVTLASSVLTTTDINGGTIDGTAIGGASAAAGAFTTLTSNGATTFTAGTASTSTTTGTAVITGGLGVSGRINAANFDGIVGANTAAAGAFTTLSASSTLSVTGAGSIQGLTVGRGAGAVATNTAVGASALAANTTGTTNTAIGQLSLLSNTSGQGNTSVGRAAVALNTTGNFNSAIGETALYSNTTGSSNTALGYTALYSNTTASNNTAVGYQAGYTNITGTGSNYFGRQAGYSSNANYNTMMGDQAGYVSTGIGNTFFGYFAGGSVTSGTYNSFFGYGSGNAMTTGSKNTIVGYYSGNQGGVDIRTSSNNIVLSDGDGYPSFWISGTNYAIKSPAFNASVGMGTTNMNDVKASGMYRFDVGTSNTPTNNYYSVVVYGNADNVVTQLATVFQGSTTYTRSYNTSWSAWVQL